MSAWISGDASGAEARRGLKPAARVLVVALGIVVMFGMAAATAEAQHRGAGRGGGHAISRGGGFGYGGWTRGNTSSFYTFNHGGVHRGSRGNRSVGRGRGGFGYSRHAAGFSQPYYYLPFINYGFGDLNDFDMDDDDGSGYEEPAPPPEPNPATAVMQMNQAALAHQLQQLHQEVNDLKSAEAAAQPAASAPEYAQPQSASEPPQPPITLVLRDGQQLKVGNYAVMNQTFWDFSNRPVRKIPLSQIDLSASERVTAANGGEFPAISVQPQLSQR